MNIYRGNIVYSKCPNELVELKRGYVVVKDGIIFGVYAILPHRYANFKVTDFGEDVIIPAFSDLHVHAPQYPNRGIAMDLLLNDWLHTYTFPLEAKYKDPKFAKEVYYPFVRDLVKNGTLHACIYGTIHNDATNVLMQALERKGICSFVGKVNMDKDSPDYLIEETNDSIEETEKFIKKNSKNIFAKPLLTPRFAPTCSFDLLKKLGKLSAKYDIGVQTHIVESKWEAEEAKKCFEGCRCDMQIYKDAGLLDHAPFIAAHYIYPCQEDLDLLKECNGVAVQCPDSTLNVIAGIMSTGKLLDMGIRVGFGSDLSAGSYIGIYTQIASSVRLSKLKNLYEPDNRQITFAEAFYIATKGGGSLWEKVGSLEQGYFFDALVLHGLQDKFTNLSPKELVERFCYLGTSKNIAHIYLRGKEL